MKLIHNSNFIEITFHSNKNMKNSVCFLKLSPVDPSLMQLYAESFLHVLNNLHNVEHGFFEKNVSGGNGIS